ncbi:hypothetical protein BaRGS_00027107 [Batillaria attramentaria]|uniref:Secreted protein n=1 Tax=Batillaria attramentaria TaxID=370345 RepID=A0ABD0K418_9CAEN
MHPPAAALASLVLSNAHSGVSISTRIKSVVIPRRCQVPVASLPALLKNKYERKITVGAHEACNGVALFPKHASRPRTVCIC